MWRVRIVPLLLLTLFASVGASPAQAQSGRRQAAVLQTVGDGVEARMVDSLSRLVRSEAEARPELHVTSAPELTLQDIQFIVGCHDTSARCLHAIRRELRVEVLVLSRLARSGERVLLEVQAFDADGARTEHARADGPAAEVQLMEVARETLQRLLNVPDGASAAPPRVHRLPNRSGARR